MCIRDRLKDKLQHRADGTQQAVDYGVPDFAEQLIPPALPLVAGTAAWLGRLWCGTTYADILKLFGNPRKAADQHSLDLLQDLHDAGGVAGIFTRFRRGRRICAGVRRGRRRGRFVGDIVVIVGYTIVGVVLFGFVVVDDGVIADICNGFVVFVDGRVFRVNIRQVGEMCIRDSPFLYFLNFWIPGAIVASVRVFLSNDDSLTL